MLYESKQFKKCCLFEVFVGFLLVCGVFVRFLWPICRGFVYVLEVCAVFVVYRIFVEFLCGF